MTEKEYVTWQDVELYVEKVCQKYQHMHLAGVYGIPRGGLILAVMISHKLGIPMLISPVENSLIVDDICDSGESLEHYALNSSSFNRPLYHISTMYYKQGAKVVPEFFVKPKEDKWIVFPWENKED